MLDIKGEPDYAQSEESQPFGCFDSHTTLR